MTRDERKTAMSEGVPPHADARRAPQGGGRRVLTPRRAGLLVLAFAISYGLTLCLLTDSLFLLAIPGLIALLTLGCMIAVVIMQRPLGGADLPYATDGSDKRGALRFHRSVLSKRYAMVAVTSVVVAALFPLTKSDYLTPLVPLGMMSLVFATYSWYDQMRRVRCCAHVLDVYEFAFRGSVEKVSSGSRGKSVLAFAGQDGSRMTVSALQPVGQGQWPEGIDRGVWFAGDDDFGGALLVPGSGELMLIQPKDWHAQQRQRSRASRERQEKARRAGLDESCI